jgi:hypothetical protein
MHETHQPYHRETPMRITDDEFRAAVRAFFDSLPPERLRSLALKFLADPFTNSQRQPRRPGRPRKDVEARSADEEKVVSLHQRKPGRRRRQKAVDAAAKLAARRKRYEAKRAAARRAARATKAIKAAAPPAGNGQDVPVTPAMLWQHAERIEPTAPWKAVAREFGVKDIHAQAAYRNQSLPPHVGAMAITKFLTLPVPN